MSASTAFNENSLPCKSEINATRIANTPIRYSDRAGELVNAASRTVAGAICNGTVYVTDSLFELFSNRHSRGARSACAHLTRRGSERLKIKRSAQRDSIRLPLDLRRALLWRGQ